MNMTVGLTDVNSAIGAQYLVKAEFLCQVLSDLDQSNMDCHFVKWFMNDEYLFY
jgi:hypothetical protein